MTDLPMNPFGSTGASVTALGYGSMDLGKKRDRRLEPVASDVAVDVLNEVLDAGINFIDTWTEVPAAIAVGSPAPPFK